MKETIVIFSDSPLSTTGFGVVTDSIVNAIIESGNTPIVVGMKTNTQPTKYKCAVLHPLSMGDPNGWDTLAITMRKTKAKLLITVMDPWNIYPIVDLKYQIGFKWIGYNPVESQPYPNQIMINRSPLKYIDNSVIFKAMDHVISYTNFGKEAINEMLLSADIKKDIKVIAHGVDTEYYTPLASKRESKAAIGLDPDVFLFSVVKTNTERSGFDILLDAWDHFYKKTIQKDPSKRIFLYIHTDPQKHGYNLIQMTKQRNSQNIIYDTNIKLGEGYDKDHIRNLYRATDVFINPTKAEGWGLTVHEAMSCGTPCIIPDYAGPAEWSDDATVRVPIATFYQPTFAATRFALMDYKKLSNAMTMLMNNDSKRELLGRRSRSVASRYTWTRFRNEWTILLGIALEDAKNVEISTLKWRSV